jgi:hypothetical protein
MVPIGSSERRAVIARLPTSRLTSQRQAQRRARRRLRASQNIAAAIRIVTTASTRKPGSTMANGMALNPATSERLAWTTTSTEAISVALLLVEGVWFTAL